MKHNSNFGKRHAYRFYIIYLRKAWREEKQRTLAKQSIHKYVNGKNSITNKQRSDKQEINNTQKNLDAKFNCEDTKVEYKNKANTAADVLHKANKDARKTKSSSYGKKKKQSSHSGKKISKTKGKKSNGMTYSQKKRASFNYRNEYFKKNPGIYSNIWFCSQCGKILIGKRNVVIDHIVPLNSIAGVNRTFNTVAICQKCNSSKSDRIDYRIAKGYLAKIFEVFTSHLPDALALILSLVVSIVYQILNLLFILVTMPFTLANGKFLTYTVVILIIFAFILSKL